MSSRVFGHDGVLAELSEWLPPVALFRGPRSVGKRTAALFLARKHGYVPADIRVYEVLNAEAARDVVSFVSRAPFGKRGKLLIVDVDSATEASLNTLLKTLEEPPPTASFILIAEHPVLDTISSRSLTYRFGLLSRADLYAVLAESDPPLMTPAAASAAADMGRGQVEVAMLRGEQDQHRASVLSVLKAVSDGDPELLSAATVRWRDEEHELLLRWISEAITGRWQVFSDAETFGLTQDSNVPRRMLLAFGTSRARPRFQVRALLAPLVESRRRA